MFLDPETFVPRPLKLHISGLTPCDLFLGQGELGLEIAVLQAERQPDAAVMQQAHKKRKGGRAAPVLIAVSHPQGVSLCGTGGDQPRVLHIKDASQVQRLCESALRRPDRNAAIRFLADAMPSLETTLPGITNEGLMSLHELTHGTQNHHKWVGASGKAKKMLGKRDGELIAALGFKRRRLDNLTDLLMTADEKKTALAVLLKDDEVPEVSTPRFNDVSPVSYALTKADKERLPWVLMVQDECVRLYNTKNVGVGRRGRTESFIECRPSLLAEDNIGLLWMLFSSEALTEDGGSIYDILESSKRFAADVAEKLRERIYDTVVPALAMGIANCDHVKKTLKDDVALIYEMALTVLFRLLFIAYAEDRDLLPYKGNEAYRHRSLKRKAMELAKAKSDDKAIGDGDYHWKETEHLWQAISQGNTEWGVPAYNGALFSADTKISRAGGELDRISLPDRCFELALRELLLTDVGEKEYAPVDFRALSVREFGTIYEGLLESELSRAEQDLMRDDADVYMPAGRDDEVCIRKGEIYLHDRSGVRKSSGSYYTPQFVVEHLLDGALEPALDEHLRRLQGMNDADQAERFFDFRVADIAMGSGHFLVAAIDRIERRFALWLEENPVPGVTRELQMLREAAKKQLGDLAGQVMIEDGQLLRRMIARRCIYGVDLNPLTVQLARLSIWIHTFVPGLPLSLLDHHLVQGNALVGIGSLEEIRRKFDQAKGTLFARNADELLGKAAKPLRKLAQRSDASVSNIEQGRALMEEARQNTRETEMLCDLITAAPVADEELLAGFQYEEWELRKDGKDGDDIRATILKLKRDILKPLSAFHFPIAFPEVFLGENEGFHAIIGNPPWKKLRVEEDIFWCRLSPGFVALEQGEKAKKKKQLHERRPDLVKLYEHEVREAKIMRDFLVATFENLGKGDLDLYKAFCNRYIALNGRSASSFGVVLPRNALFNAGSELFRRTLVTHYASLSATILKNTGGWVFENIDGRYSIALLLCLNRMPVLPSR